MSVLALFSFLMYRSLRRVVLIASTGAGRRRSSPGHGEWMTGVDLMTRNPLGFFLPYLLGPRWNCHELSARLAGIDVQRTLAVDTSGMESMASFSLFVHDHRLGLVRWLAGGDVAQSRTIELEPGRYSLSVRAYADDGVLRTPAVFVDGTALKPCKAFEDEGKRLDEFLTTIRNKDSLFYRFLQFHAFYAVSRRDSLPVEWSHKAFLPAANPQTSFVFGLIEAGKRLRIRVSRELCEAGLILVSQYNKSSFPTDWKTINGDCVRLDPTLRDGAYLVRVVPRGTGGAMAQQLQSGLEIDVVDGK